MYTFRMKLKPHSRKLRMGRASITGQVYLVTSVTHQRSAFFGDLQAGRTVVKSMQQTQFHGAADTLAFVVMPDHLHWLFSLGPSHSVSTVVSGVKSYSAMGVNRILSRRGRVWQRGFHDHALRRDEDLVHVARYIIANPLRAGLVKRLGDYPLWDAVWV